MNPIKFIANKVIKFSAEHTENQSHLQNICGSTAMALSCAAFTGSVLMNRGIPTDQKEFLVSQELVDGATNVALFWTMTAYFKKKANEAVTKGRIFPAEFKEKVEAARAKLGDGANLESIKKAANFTGKECEKLEHFHDGFINMVSLGGSLVGASLITPVIRNIAASIFQKKADFSGNKAQKTVNKPAVDSSKQNISQKPYSTTYQSFKGGMRI